MRTMNQLCDIEDAGHAVDWEAMEEQCLYGEPFMEQMEVAARESLALMRGPDTDYSTLNFNAPKQMGKVLYEDLNLHTTRKTKTGNLSTDATALERLAKEHTPVKKVLEVREVGNLAGRLKKWTTEYTVAHDKRVHASFNQVVVGSGRFSANDPAIQQLPKEWRWTTLLSPEIKVWDDDHWAQIVESENTVFGKHYWGGNFRDFMVAGENCYLLFFDYSQIELRALAGMSQEPYLIDAFNRGVDIHRATAAMMLGMDLAVVKDKDRSRGKTLNFGIVYGMGPGLLADELGIDKSEAEELLAQYMSAFTEVSGWIARQKAIGKEYGFVETHFGRKVTLWDLQSSNFAIYGKGERLCVNAPVQGTAADIMKIAMLRTEKALRERGWWMTKVRIINNVHDALTFEVDNSVDPRELREIIQAAVVWEIPTFPEIVVDWELGQNWGHAAKWKDGDEPYFDGRHWRIEKAPKAPEPVPEPVVVHQTDFTVQTSEMPSREALKRFVALLQDHPGDNVVTLDTPEGEVVLHAYTTSLTPQDQGEISLALDGARAFVPVTVDVERLAEGLTL
jgi:DNA polymerase-1